MGTAVTEVPPLTHWLLTEPLPAWGVSLSAWLVYVVLDPQHQRRQGEG